MTPRIDKALSRIVGVLEQWDEVTAVALNSQGDDRYDPYFALSLDVYTRSEVRVPEAREPFFGDVGAFESSLLRHKDRFLIDDMPIRLEYKRTDRFDQIVASAAAGECRLRDSGTYAFRRMVDAQVLSSRGSWIESIRATLSRLPQGFWDQLRHSQESIVEHLYADLGAAAMRDDPVFFVMSAGRFLTRICALLFTVNRRFEPAPRALNEEVLMLENIPGSFPANLENFVMSGEHFTLSQRAELAHLMVSSVLSL